MGVLAIACSICIGTFTEILAPITIKILAASSTLFLTIISAYSLPAKANNVRKGWRHLNKVIYNYKCGAISIKELIVVYEEGEILIGDVDFNYDKPHFNKSQDSDENKKSSTKDVIDESKKDLDNTNIDKEKTDIANEKTDNSTEQV